jgi:hypothetical protein
MSRHYSGLRRWGRDSRGASASAGQPIPLNRDYAATFATIVKNGFEGLLPQGKYPKVYFLEAQSSNRRHDSISFLEKVIFSKI